MKDVQRFRETLDHCVPMLTALFIGAGDDPGTCRRSVEDGWRRHPLPGGDQN